MAINDLEDYGPLYDRYINKITSFSEGFPPGRYGDHTPIYWDDRYSVFSHTGLTGYGGGLVRLANRCEGIVTFLGHFRGNTPLELTQWILTRLDQIQTVGDSPELDDLDLIQGVLKSDLNPEELNKTAEYLERVRPGRNLKKRLWATLLWEPSCPDMHREMAESQGITRENILRMSDDLPARAYHWDRRLIGRQPLEFFKGVAEGTIEGDLSSVFEKSKAFQALLEEVGTYKLNLIEKLYTLLDPDLYLQEARWYNSTNSDFKTTQAKLAIYHGIEKLPTLTKLRFIWAVRRREKRK